MKANFKCPRCRKMQKVGKRLHASWTCPNCHNSIVISKEVKEAGFVKYKKDFSSFRFLTNKKEFGFN